MSELSLPRTCRGLVVVFVISLLANLAGCGGGGSSPVSHPVTPTPAALVSINVTPPTASVAAGLQQQFTATGSFADGTSQLLTSVTWATSDQTLSNVSNTGLAISLHPGTSTVTATSGSISGSSQLIIGPPVFTRIGVSPASATIQIGSSSPQNYSATAFYSDQSTVSLGSQVTWSVTNPLIAGVDTSGAASPLRSGFTKLTATFGKFSGTASLTVLATPRYLYNLSDAGREVSRLTINAVSGQPRYMGYQTTKADNNVGFGCITTDPSNRYAYVATQVLGTGGYAGQISAYKVNGITGTLTPFSNNPYSVTQPLGCVQFEPGGNFAYATPGIEETNNELMTLAKDSLGNLSIVSSLSLPTFPAGLAIDPLGKLLYVVAEGIAGAPAYVYGYRIDASTGTLSAIDGPPFKLPTSTYGYLSFSPSGDYLYVADNSNNGITGFNINRSTGVLTAGAAEVHPCINPTALQFSPDGSLAFTTCSMDNNHAANSSALVSFTVSANGQLTQVGTAPSGFVQWVTVDPSGHFLYVIGTGTNSVNSQLGLSTYKVNSDGSTALLSQTAGRFMQNGLILLGGATPVTYTTRYAYVTTSGDSKLASFAVNLDGTLTSLQTTPTLSSPVSLAMLPWDSDLLVAAHGAGSNFQAYAVNDSTGALTPGFSFRNAVTPGGIIVDPSGTVAFMSDSSSGVIYKYGYSNSPGFWGSWGTVQGLPGTFPAQGGPGPLAIDPSGRSIFVANQTANSISEFEYAGAAPVAPFPIPASPLAICVDTSGTLLFVAGSDNKLRMLTIDGEGSLTDAFDVDLAGVPASVAVEPTGHYVYVGSTAGLSAFTINQHTGNLTALSLPHSVSLGNVVGVYIEPSGQYLYASVSNSNTNTIYLFTIQADGTLSSTDMAIQTSDKVAAMVFHSQVQ